jgi:hypothetical protein
MLYKKGGSEKLIRKQMRMIIPMPYPRYPTYRGIGISAQHPRIREK